MVVDRLQLLYKEFLRSPNAWVMYILAYESIEYRPHLSVTM